MSADVYVEKWVPFVKELAVMVVRGKDGAVAAYPTVETVQKDNICHVVVAPAQIDGQVAAAAQRLARQAIESLDGPGVFGVEMFLLKDGPFGKRARKRAGPRATGPAGTLTLHVRMHGPNNAGTVLLNEVAPRVHNSGHYTMDACECSQFEQHIRVVTGMPLGSTAMKARAPHAPRAPRVSCATCAPRLTGPARSPPHAPCPSHAPRALPVPRPTRPARSPPHAPRAPRGRASADAAGCGPPHR